eukprot:1102195-Rhodomonas_salina.1
MRLREQAGDERSAKTHKSAPFNGESFTEHFCTSNKCSLRQWLLMTFKEDSPRRIGCGGALHHDDPSPPNNVLVASVQLGACQAEGP